ncbi:MAG TPA: SDR family NAD(P)-dependent oxidoreductase [Longimicrobiaceae bacterium]|nr:SDR family NAD(P)-dependent oxidoreductase [Longimicrobiaceae bacterium]
MSEDRAERCALVTGTSSGIGAATARAFAAAGFRVFGTSRTERQDADGVEMLRLDVRSDESVARCLAEIRSRGAWVEVLVNNAGVEHLGIAEETTLEEARAVFETNFFGVVRLTDALLPEMRTRQCGRIINVGSAAAWVGEPGEAFYSASKRALAGYTEALRHEVWPLGIEVSLVEPGAFRTNVIEAASSSEGTIPDYDAVREAARRTLRESLRGGGDPSAVASLIVDVARTTSPRLRYAVGSEARWLPYLRVLLPQRAFDRLLRRGFGLSRSPSEGRRR